MQRKSLFCIVHLIVPCVNISVLAVFVFLVPSDSRKKIRLSISILVSLLVFYLLLIELIPSTSLVTYMASWLRQILLIYLPKVLFIKRPDLPPRYVNVPHINGKMNNENILLKLQRMTSLLLENKLKMKKIKTKYLHFSFFLNHQFLHLHRRRVAFYRSHRQSSFFNYLRFS
jgi:hypothetical protein